MSVAAASTLTAQEPRRLLIGLRAILVGYVALVAALTSGANPAIWTQVAVLAGIAVAASTPVFNERLGLGAPIVEAVVVSAATVAVALGANDVDVALTFLPYALVPCLVAGLRGGLLWAVLTTAAAEAVLAVPVLIAGLDPNISGSVRTVVAWGLVALAVGALGAWVRSLDLRRQEVDPAYLSAHRLLTELWLVARQLSAGLDPQTLAQTMLDEVREQAPYRRAAVFVRSRGGFLVPLVVDGADRVDWDASQTGESLLAEAWTSDGVLLERGGFDGSPGVRAAFPLRIGVRTFGIVALECEPSVVAADIKSAMSEAEESVVRLETALLFADVRSVATTEERRRMSREIHDGIAQELTSLGYVVDDLVDRTKADPVNEDLRSLRGEITRLISELRLSIFDLRSDVSSSARLGAALSDHVQRIGAAARGPTIHLVLDESPQRLRLDTEVEVLRIAQEAIMNARKHSQAANLWVRCIVDPPAVLLSVEDDGVGLGPSRQDSFGLQVMRERAQRIGGQLLVEEGEHGGTSVTLRLGDPAPTAANRPKDEVDA